MLIDYLGPQKLKRLHSLAAARGQSLSDWIDDLIAASDRQGDLGPRMRAPTVGFPLVDLACDYLVRLCGSDAEIRRLASALRAAAIDGEHCRVGPLASDGLTLELSPQWEGVRVVGGGGRFTLEDAAALQLAERLLAECQPPTLAA